MRPALIHVAVRLGVSNHWLDRLVELEPTFMLIGHSLVASLINDPNSRIIYIYTAISQMHQGLVTFC